jgi:MATE family multidrug resistance protein
MRRELLPMLKLAGPVILAEIGWMSMSVVDTIMVGPLGPAAIGATGMSSSLYLAIAVFGTGVMLGLDAVVSQSYGAGRLDDCVRWLQHGVLLALIVSPAVMIVFYAGLLGIGALGLHAQVQALAMPYLRVVALSTPPLLLYATFRRYLQGIHAVRPVMFALVSANLVNVAANWMLIYGRLGAPALGVEGAAWATVAARV